MHMLSVKQFKLGALKVQYIAAPSARHCCVVEFRINIAVKENTNIYIALENECRSSANTASVVAVADV